MSYPPISRLTRARFASLRGRPLHFGEPSRRERGFRLRNLSAAYRLLFVYPYYVSAVAAFAALGFSAAITDESLTWHCVYFGIVFILMGDGWSRGRSAFRLGEVGGLVTETLAWIAGVVVPRIGI